MSHGEIDSKQGLMQTVSVKWKWKSEQSSHLTTCTFVCFSTRLNRYYKPSVLLMCFLVPMFTPWYLWGESLWVGYFVPAVLRYTMVLNASWLVNSAAHMWGNRPYDKNIGPRENKFVTFSAIGMRSTWMCWFVSFLNTMRQDGRSIPLSMFCQSYFTPIHESFPMLMPVHHHI